MRRDRSAELGECVFSERLDCGLCVYVMPRRGWGRRSALLAVDFGALDRKLWLDDASEPLALPAGVAHFLEHRLFEKAEGDIAERFAARGADVDADTAFTYTGFTFSCRESFASSLELLIELVFTLWPDGTGVAREREIIGHEIELSADALDWVGYFRALAAVFPGQALTEDIAGTSASLERIDSQLLLRCHEALFRPANAALFVSGDVDPGEVMRLVDRQLAGYAQALQRRAGGRVCRPAIVPGPAQRCVSTLPVTRPHLTLAFGDPQPGLDGPDLLRREMALELVLYALLGPGSDFYRDSYEAGLIDAGSFGFEVDLEPSFGVCLVGSETSEPGALEAAVLATLARAQASGLDAADVELGRRRAYSDLVRALDSADGCVEAMHSAVSCGAQPLELFAVHRQVQLSEAEACLESFLQPDTCGVSLIMPSASAAAGSA